MTSGSSVSTCIALASARLRTDWGGQPWELQGTVNLILVLAAHETAHSTAPRARLQDGLDDQATTTSTAGRTPFSARNGAPRQGLTELQGRGYWRARSAGQALVQSRPVQSTRRWRARGRG